MAVEEAMLLTIQPAATAFELSTDIPGKRSPVEQKVEGSRSR
jgi:hypothetical protein